MDIVAPAQEAIQFSQHVEVDGRAFHAAVDGMDLEGMVSKRSDSTYRSGRTEAWLKTKCFIRSELEVASVLRERGKPPIAYMVDHDRRYLGGAFIALNREQREQLWSRVSGDVSTDGAEQLHPGLRGRVRHLRGEKELRHATWRKFGSSDDASTRRSGQSPAVSD